MLSGFGAVHSMPGIEAIACQGSSPQQCLSTTQCCSYDDVNIPTNSCLLVIAWANFGALSRLTIGRDYYSKMDLICVNDSSILY